MFIAYVLLLWLLPIIGLSYVVNEIVICILSSIFRMGYRRQSQSAAPGSAVVGYALAVAAGFAVVVLRLRAG